MNNEPEIAVLLAAWDLSGWVSLVPLEGGTNSEVYLVESSSGQKWVLRLILNHSDLGRINFETAIVNRLQAFNLPFMVPAPLPTRAGKFLAASGNKLANLWPLVPGANPEEISPERAFQAGQGLGHLAQALAQIKLPENLDYIPPPPYGDLDHAHPFLTNPLEAIETLPVEPDIRARLLVMVAEMQHKVPPLYQRLPQQLIHSDFNRYNIMMEGDRLSGVLDFEYATWDLRVMDLAVALSAWSLPLMGTNEGWPVIEAFVRGYAAISPLTDGEKAALPLLIRLRFVTVLLHFIGRYRQGLSAADDYERWVNYALKIEDWMATNHARLTRLIQTF